VQIGERKLREALHRVERVRGVGLGVVGANREAELTTNRPLEGIAND
jgi:hypothetical protein